MIKLWIACTIMAAGLYSLPTYNKIYFKDKMVTTGTGMRVKVPLGGNTWKRGKGGGIVGRNGIMAWTDAAATFSAYVRLAATGRLSIFLNAKVALGKSRLQITVNGTSYPVEMQGAQMMLYKAGDWDIRDTGYVRIEIKGLTREGSSFADIESIEAEGTAVNEQTAYVKDDEGNFFYWGRRGPSVHLSYQLPDSVQAEWFYNEVTVPAGQDVIGSYFMVNGFAEGYFGIQVNSETERRILFSVWSPFNTDNPKDIPADQQIRLLRKGEAVHTGEFGNEGAGGQSYLKYGWKAAVTYRFLLHARPVEENHTIYTAYFFEPAAGRWQLIAEFKRPRTTTYIRRPHSFLENFNPETGETERKVLFSNQWIRDTNGKWKELTRARFTGDNTAGKGYRMDYGGGIEGGAFYLRNCGFFPDYTRLNKVFERTPSGRQPDVDNSLLP